MSAAHSVAVASEPDSTARARQDRQLSELIDLVWQTDELRVQRPTPLDEARNALFYLNGILGQTLSGLTCDLSVQMESRGASLSPVARPLTFGSWIGGDRDGNPNVTPAVTRAVLRLQFQEAVRLARSLLDELIEALSASSLIVDASAELTDSLAADLAALPELPARLRAINVEEPYRLKLSCMKQKLANTQHRVELGAPHARGRDYLGHAELIGELSLLAASLRSHSAHLVADGLLARVTRTLSVTGLLITGAGCGVVAIKVVAPQFLSPTAANAVTLPQGGEGGGDSASARTTVKRATRSGLL